MLQCADSHGGFQSVHDRHLNIHENGVVGEGLSCIKPLHTDGAVLGPVAGDVAESQNLGRHFII